jgi:hypothetical protein
MQPRIRAIIGKIPFAIIFVVVAAVFVRLAMFVTNIGGAIFDKILWYDEAYSVFFAEHGLAEIIRFSGLDTTPPLFAVLLHYWAKAAGVSVLALSFFPFILSIAAMPLVYILAKDYFGARAGWLAALLVALNPLHVKFSTEIRTYSLIFCLAVLSLIFLRRYLERRRTWDGLWWVAVSVLGMYAHYTFLFFFVLENLYILTEMSVGTFKDIRKWLWLQAAAAAACLPLVFWFQRWGDFVNGGVSGNSYFSRAFGHGTPLSFLNYFAALFFGERRFYAETWFWAVISLGLGALVIVWLAAAAWQRRGDRGAALLAFMTFGGIVMFMAAGFIYDPRYYLIFVAPAAVLAASSMAPARGWRLPIAVVAVVLCQFMPLTGALEVTPALAFKYYAPYFVEKLQAQERPGDLLLLDHFSDTLFRIYYRGSLETKVYFPMRGRNVDDMFERFRYFDYDLMSPADTATLASLVAGHDRVWMIDYYPQRTSLQDPTGLKRRWFSENYLLRQAIEFPPGGEEPEAQTTLLLLYEKE